MYDDLTCTGAAAAGRTAGAGPASARGGTAAARPPRGTPTAAPAHTTAPPAPAPGPATAPAHTPPGPRPRTPPAAPRCNNTGLASLHTSTVESFYLYQWLYAFKCNAFYWNL